MSTTDTSRAWSPASLLEDHGVADCLPLKVQGLGLTIGHRTLLDQISFRLDRRNTTILLGPNGAGKTLLLRICHGLMRPSRGSLEWGNLPMQQARSRQAFVFQKPVMLRRSTYANIDYALKLHKIPRAERERRVIEVLDRTDLISLKDQPARVLSGGEQQRLAIARALALRPEVLLLDEPSSHLDPSAVHAIEELLRSVRQSGVKLIMTTHDLAQARRLADEVLFMHRGRLLEQSPADRFFDSPSSAAARAYVSGELLHDQNI